MIRFPEPFPGPPARARRGSLRALACGALLVAACGAESRREAQVVSAEPDVAPASAPSAAPAPAESSSTPEPSLFAEGEASSEPGAAPGVEEKRERKGLDAFYEALSALERKERKEHVRVLWFGDSHGAADFWTGALRSGLQAKFGDGGPGFVHVGYRGARNGRAAASVEGKWRTRPKGPSTRVPSSDGIFGLGGMMTSAYGGAARAVVTPKVQGDRELVFDLCYRLGQRTDAFSFSLGGAKKTVRANPDAPAGELRHLVREAPSSASLSVAPLSGRPEFCGLVVESKPSGGAGVVLDNLGINGARYGTMLAWNEPAFRAELARRTPDLVIFQFGTNEATDEHVPAANVGKDLERAVGRVRSAAPNAACLVVGPPDRADRGTYIVALRDAIEASARASGCAFWDVLAAMGGPGGIRSWGAESPPRAARDGIHLTARGYKFLGESLLEELLGGYSKKTKAAAARAGH